MQSLSLEQKIRMSQNRIRDWYEYYDGNVYVARIMDTAPRTGI